MVANLGRASRIVIFDDTGVITKVDSKKWNDFWKLEKVVGFPEYANTQIKTISCSVVMTSDEIDYVCGFHCNDYRVDKDGYLVSMTTVGSGIVLWLSYHPV